MSTTTLNVERCAIAIRCVAILNRNVNYISHFLKQHFYPLQRANSNPIPPLTDHRKSYQQEEATLATSHHENDHDHHDRDRDHDDDDDGDDDDGRHLHYVDEYHKHESPAAASVADTDQQNLQVKCRCWDLIQKASTNQQVSDTVRTQQQTVLHQVACNLSANPG